MTELALILAIQAAGLAFAVALVRALFADHRESSPAQRVASALERASRGVLARARRDVAIGGAVLLAVLSGVHAVRWPSTASLSALQAALVAALGLLAGAVFAGAAGYAALRIGVQSSVAVIAAARTSLDRCLSVAVRAGGAAALTGEALALLGFSSFVGITFALKGGTTLDPAAALGLARELTTVAPSFTLGAALAALVVQRAAGTYRAASEVAASVAAELDAGLSRDDPRNPALVGGVAGTLLAGHAATTALAFTLASASHLCTLSIATRAIEAGAPLSGLLVPFVVRAFFVVAVGFGLLVVRTEEMKSPSFALLRGQLCAGIIGWVGVVGSALWLLRTEWQKLALVGLAGVGCSLLGAFTTWVLSLRRPSAGELDDRSSDARVLGISALGAVGRGFEAAFVPVAVLAPLALWYLHATTGSASSPSPADALVALSGWSAFAGMLPLSIAASCVGSTALSARRVAALAGAGLEAQRRIQRLIDARLTVSSPRAQLLLTAAGTAFVAALALPGLAAASAGVAAPVLEPIVLWSAALGSALVLAYAGASARAAAHGAERVSLEAGRQLREARKNQPAALPDDFSPSYKSCVDLAAQLSRARVLPHVLAALALPIALVVGIRLFGRAEAGALVVDALVGFVAAAAFTGFAAASTLDAAHEAITSRRFKRAPDGGPVPIAAAGEALTTVLGQAAGPAAQALLLATACAALAIAPFLN